MTTTATKDARQGVWATLAALTGLLLCLPACTSADRVPGQAAAEPTLAEPTGSPTSGSSPSPTAPGADKLLVIVAENRSAADVSTHMPFLKSDSRRYGTATKYNAITYPSPPNYLVMAGGSTFGVKDNAT